MNEDLRLFLLGFFSEFIDRLRNSLEPEISLTKICYLESLLNLNKFDEYYEEIEKTQNDAEKELLLLYFKFFTFDAIPSYYFSKFTETRDYKDYYDEFEKLYKLYNEWIEVNKSNNRRVQMSKALNNNIFSYSHVHFIRLRIYQLILKKIDNFFKLRKYYLEDYVSVRNNILNFTKKIASEYDDLQSDSSQQDQENQENIWQALIFDCIGAVYSYYDNLKHKERLYYEKSISCKFNIFALTDLIDTLIDDNEITKAKDIIKGAQSTKVFDIEETQYYSYFDSKARLFEKENQEKTEENYYKAFKIIKEFKYKTIANSYPYYNFALDKDENKEYETAERYFSEALEILQEASGIGLNGKIIDENFIYFLDDFRDYLYEICKVQIAQSKNEPYSNTLRYIVSLRDTLNEYPYLKADLDYDIAILKSKIYDSKKQYDKMIEEIEELEKNLEKEKLYLSPEYQADLRARLAYGYLQIQNIDKYNENIQKTIELDPSNKLALKLMAQFKNPTTRLFSKDHWKHIYWMSLITLGSFGLIALIYEMPPNPLIIITILVPFYIVILYPIINFIRIGKFEISLKEGMDIRSKNEKFI